MPDCLPKIIAVAAYYSPFKQTKLPKVASGWWGNSPFSTLHLPKPAIHYLYG
jgi:hypothetical protein